MGFVGCDFGYKVITNPITYTWSCQPCPAGSTTFSYYDSVCTAVCNPGQYINGSTCASCPISPGASAMTSPGGLSSQAQCTISSCLPGFYKSGNNCVEAPIGYYSPGGTSALLACPGDSTSPIRSSSISQCAVSSCPSGKFISNGQCSSCGAGTYSAGGTATVCRSCAAGQYSAAGAASCSTCAAGQYSPAGAAFCTTCTNTIGASAMTSPAGSTSQSQCTASACSSGYSLNNGVCKSSSCMPGYYLYGTTCTACGAGTSSAGGTATSCTSCGVGTYSTGTASNCTACSSNQYTTGIGSTAAASCLPLPTGGSQDPVGGFMCSSNYYKNGTTCTPLPSNSSRNSTNDGYVCNTGFYKNGTTCTPLPSNADLNSSGTGYVCRSSYYNNGTSCSVLPSNATVSSSGTSFTCLAGFSQSATGCTQCLAGTSAAAGAISCSSCGAGTYSSSAGASNCLSPPPNATVNSSATGFTCSSGFYNNNGTCIPLPSNATLNAAGTGFICPAGYSQSATGCTPCGPGTYSSSNGATACLSPPPNATVNSSATGFACSTGFYNNNGTCTALPSNATLNAAGTSFICAAGFSQSATSCTQCSIGYYSGSPGATSCTACGANQYTTSNSATSCLTLPSNAVLNAAGTGYACSSNYYNSNGTCLSPPPNATVNSSGTGYICGTGFYGTGTACAPLPSNATANSSGTGFTCPVGYSQSTTGCTQCLAGTYNNVAGATSCSACGSSSYSAAGASNCTTLPQNATPNATGTGFVCNSNYYNNGTSCAALPSNASINSNGTGFVCGTGYMQGPSSCMSCGVGTYNSIAGSSVCTTCALITGVSAMTSPQGSSSQSNCTATSCQPGYGFSSGNCTQCGAGFFGSGGTTTCVACSQTGYTSPAGSSNSNACYCPNTNLPPRSQGSVSNTLAALNTCVPNGTNIYNYTIGTSVTTTNPCTGQSFYDFDRKVCVDSYGNVVTGSSTNICASNQVYSQQTNACLSVSVIVKPGNPQLTGTTGTPGPGDYNNCQTVDQGDCTLLFKNSSGAFTSTNPCLANGKIYNFATKACSTAANPCCSITNPLAATAAGCANDIQTVYTKNASKCPVGNTQRCCVYTNRADDTCKTYWTKSTQFTDAHTASCATSAFSDYGDNNKIDTIAEKRTKRLIRIRA